MKRYNVQEAFVGEPDGSAGGHLDNYANGDEAVDIEVRGGKIQLVVPAGTPDDGLFDCWTVLGGLVTLEDGRTLNFQIQADSVGAQVAVDLPDEREPGAGLSSIPDVPGGV